MRTAPALALLAGLLLAGPAQAQGGSDGGFKPDIMGAIGEKPVDPETEEKRKEIDRAYQATTRKIPEQKQPVDPWGSIRGPEPVPAAKSKAKQQSGAK
jgi:hypothetical protein